MLVAETEQVATRVDQPAARPGRNHGRRGLVDREALGDPAEVEDAGAPQPGEGAVQRHVAPVGPRVRLGLAWVIAPLVAGVLILVAGFLILTR